MINEFSFLPLSHVFCSILQMRINTKKSKGLFGLFGARFVIISRKGGKLKFHV